MRSRELKYAEDIMNSPAYQQAVAEKDQRDAKKAAETATARRDLHGALTLLLNKIVTPFLLQKCWNYAVEDRPITYAQSAALCFGMACVKSFCSDNFSLR